MTAASPLIDVHTLAAALGDADLLVVDCRFDLADTARGAREYAQAHVPGAVYADLHHELSDPAKTGLGRHPLPDATAFSAVLQRWGWLPGMRVVACDDAAGALAAARLWWMLRLAGESQVSVLDGGLRAWREAGLPLGNGSVSRHPSDVRVEFDASQVVYTDELLRERNNVFLLDARAAPRFRGENETIDKVAGHIPGAHNRPFADNLGPDGRFKPAATLRAEYEALLAGTPASSVVHSCGSGVTACHNLLAMTQAGLDGSRVYAPSWSGWIADGSREVAVGAA